MVIPYQDKNIAQGGGKRAGQALVNQSVEMNIAAIFKFIPLQDVKEDSVGYLHGSPRIILPAVFCNLLEI